jgi:hypothetical protein
MYELVSSYFGKIYEKLYDLIEGTDNLKDCIINYITATQKMEIVDGDIKGTLTLNGYEYVNCRIMEGIFEHSNFYGCEINNSQMSTSKIEASDVIGSKVLSCRVENSSLTNCYFMNGVLNGDMSGGVFRSGELGPYATISSDTKVVGTTDNFFDTKFDSQEKSYKDDIKGFKK